MTSLHTDNPVALRYLMSETIYGFDLQEAGPPKSILGEAVSSEEEPAPVAQEEPYFDFLGQNRQGYLFVVNDSAHDYMSPAALDAFQKTVQALGLQLEDIALWNRGKERLEIALEQVVERFRPAKLVFLGQQATLHGIPSMALDSMVTVSGIKVLLSHGFEEMLTDMEKKKSFWKLLKTL